MKVTTLRLPEGLYDDLVEEAEAQDLSFSEYVRMLLRNREENTNTLENTPAHTEANTLADRVDALEERLAELEASPPAPEQQPAAPPSPAMEAGAVDDLPGAVDVDDNPHSQTVERAVQWAIEHQPVQRAEVIAAFEDQVDINGDSLWKRHIRDALKEAGFKHDRTGGVATWQQ